MGGILYQAVHCSGQQLILQNRASSLGVVLFLVSVKGSWSSDPIRKMPVRGKPKYRVGKKVVGIYVPNWQGC